MMQATNHGLRNEATKLSDWSADQSVLAAVSTALQLPGGWMSCSMWGTPRAARLPSAMPLSYCPCPNALNRRNPSFSKGTTSATAASPASMLSRARSS